jgi:hypothetical protein
MGKTINPDGTETVPARAGDPRALSKVEVEQAAAALLSTIPDVAEDDGTGILAGILAADDWEGLNMDSHLPNGKDQVGRKLSVQALAKRQSEIEVEDGVTKFRLTHYLIVDSADVDSGEFVRWQTSAPALVLGLAKLHSFGKLPAVIEVYEGGKDRPGLSRPLNLRVHAVH